MSYKLFLDDIRKPADVKWVEMPLGPWKIARCYQEFVDTIKMFGLPEFISFDHDLSMEHYPVKTNVCGEINYSSYKEKTGFECAKWLCEYCMDHKCDVPAYQVHSMNPVGRENIKMYIESYKSVRETFYKKYE